MADPTPSQRCNKKQMTKGHVFILTFLIIGLANLAKIFILKGEETFFNQPITTIAIIVLTLIGVLIKNEFFYGIGIAAVLPSFLLAINDIMNGNLVFFIHVSILVIGCIIFLEMKPPKWYYMLLDAAIYDYLLFLPEFKLSEGIMEMFGNIFVTYFYVMVFLSAFIMVIFTYMKNFEESNKLACGKFSSDEDARRSSNSLNQTPNKTRFEIYLDNKIKNAWLRKHAVLFLLIILVLLISFLKYLFIHNMKVLFTISIWSFVASFLSILVYTPILSSEVVAMSPPIIYLMIFDIEFERGMGFVIPNAIYHGFIVATGFYIFFKKKSAKWEYIFVWGLLLKMMSYVINHFSPGYIVNLEDFMILVYVDTVITSILYFFQDSRHRKNKRSK
ncbi:MAG: hypothetical protein GF364_17800 [Candidatus Lokiarchaeota archaeon]|nr:hypothetical protein [Candidatus Lokiarchaeota archaeon]